jgi:hypothetical protein
MRSASRVLRTWLRLALVLIAGPTFVACADGPTEPAAVPVTSWTVDVPPVYPLTDVWGTSSSDVYAVGYGGTILHYDGAGWSEMTSGTSAALRGVWGTSSSDVYAVGNSGTILHFDGTSWSEMTSGTSATMSAVWGTSPSDIFAVGSATILHFDGTRQFQTISPQSPFRGSCVTLLFTESYGWAL